MSGVIYVMAILGCGDVGAGCDEVRIDPVRYGSETACNAAATGAIYRHTDILYPVIVAQCRRESHPVLADARIH